MKYLTLIGTWVKSHVLVTVIASVVVVGGSIGTVATIHHFKEVNKTNIELNDNLNFELDSDVYLISLIKKISNGELLTKNEKVDTSKLGKQEVIIKYRNSKNEEKKYKFNINIVDATKPVIEYNKELSTTVGTEIDLLKDVKVTDNSKEELTATVEGEYDINKVGTYNLKYIVSDSSGNKTEEEFILNVKSATIKIGSYYSSSGKIMNVEFENDKKISIDFDPGCDGPCGGYSEIGTYVIEGNKIMATMTHYYALVETELDKINKLEFTIISENQIKNDSQVFNYKG